jgi:hypothetical protein
VLSHYRTQGPAAAPGRLRDLFPGLSEASYIGPGLSEASYIGPASARPATSDRPQRGQLQSLSKLGYRQDEGRFGVADLFARDEAQAGDLALGVEGHLGVEIGIAELAGDDHQLA